MNEYNEFIKDITYLKMESPELIPQLEEIEEMVRSWIRNEIFQGNEMIKELLKNHKK